MCILHRYNKNLKHNLAMISFINTPIKLYTIFIVLSALVVSCIRPTNLGQQYLDGKFTNVVNAINKPKTNKKKTTRFLKNNWNRLLSMLN